MSYILLMSFIATIFVGCSSTYSHPTKSPTKVVLSNTATVFTQVKYTSSPSLVSHPTANYFITDTPFKISSPTVTALPNSSPTVTPMPSPTTANTMTTTATQESVKPKCLVVEDPMEDGFKIDGNPLRLCDQGVCILEKKDQTFLETAINTSELDTLFSRLAI
jgi:hypothetical protein